MSTLLRNVSVTTIRRRLLSKVNGYCQKTVAKKLNLNSRSSTLWKNPSEKSQRDNIYEINLAGTNQANFVPREIKSNSFGQIYPPESMTFEQKRWKEYIRQQYLLKKHLKVHVPLILEQSNPTKRMKKLRKYANECECCRFMLEQLQDDLKQKELQAAHEKAFQELREDNLKQMGWCDQMNKFKDNLTDEELKQIMLKVNN